MQRETPLLADSTTIKTVTAKLIKGVAHNKLLKEVN
jgi:hypothetical protein